MADPRATDALAAEQRKPVTAESRSQHRAAALARWDKVADRTAATQAWRDGRRAKLRAQVLTEQPHLDPGRDDAEIEARVQRKLDLALEQARHKSLISRRKAAQAKSEAATKALEARLAQTDAMADAIIEAQPDAIIEAQPDEAA